MLIGSVGEALITHGAKAYLSYLVKTKSINYFAIQHCSIILKYDTKRGHFSTCRMGAWMKDHGMLSCTSFVCLGISFVEMQKNG